MKLTKLLLAISLALHCFSGNLFASTAQISEIKGAYIINFIKFARFEPPKESHTLCLVEEDQIAEFIDKNSKTKLSTVHLEVKIVKHSDDLQLCTVIYAADGNKIKLLEGQLLITDVDGGGIIEFIPTGDNTLTFGISSLKASKSKIGFPAQVMNLATLLDKTSLNESSTFNVFNFKEGDNNYLNYSSCNLASHCNSIYNKSHLG